MDIILTVLGILASALLSWWITDRYYKKNLKNQENEFSKEMTSLLKPSEASLKISKERFRQDCIEKGVREYKQAGTPVRVIDTFDIPDEEKAEIFDSVMMRARGSLPKVNKYRDGEK